MIHNSSWIANRNHHQVNLTFNCITGHHLTELIHHTFYGNVLALPVAIICIFIINRIGRKWLCFCLITLTAIIEFLIMLIDTTQSTMILAVLYYAIANNAWIPIKLWASELFPTELRSSVFGFANILGSSAIAGTVAIFASLFYVNCVAIMTLLAILTSISAIACLLLPDTTDADIL